MVSAMDRSVSILTVLAVLATAGAARAEDREARAEFLRKALMSVPADCGERTLAPYFFVRSDDDGTERLPLKAVDAEVNIAGVIAQVKLTQVYRNEGDSTLEAIYIFPASTRAAVYAMKMTVGRRVIEAEIRKRKEAREEYEKAREEGRTASLLTQLRPNVFQMSVANILPGDEIRVQLSYTELLVPEDKRYEFVLPTVVGPRYSNMPAADAPDTESWVANPYLKAGEKPPYTFDLRLTVHAGMPVARVSSPSHRVDVEYEGERVACISIEGDPAAGNRDFVLRYGLAGDRIEHGLLLYEGEDENFFLLMMEPPEQIKKTDLVAREYLFILDVSGSMAGFPLDTSKELMKKLLRDLRSYDYFNVLLFAGGSQVLAPGPLPATRNNVRRAAGWIDRARGGGGTELLPALRRALSMPRKKGVSRSVVVLTDGYVRVERRAFELIREKLGQANLFAFGIGSSVNRHLIEGMARAGMGEPFVVLDPGEAGRTAERFRDYVSAPLMQGVSLEFDGFEAYDVEPAAVPDLFASRPVTVFGKWRGEPEGRITVSGHGAGGDLSGAVALADADLSADNAALRHLWARHRIHELSDLGQFGRDEDLVAEVTRLGLKYSLLTDHTSFVAVDTVVRADGRKTTTVRQPLPMPQGVPDSAVGGVIGGQGLMKMMGSHGSGFGSGMLYLRGRGMGGGGFSNAKGSPMITGSLDKSAVKRTIRRNLRSVRAVYEKMLKSNPKLSGKVVVRIEIGPDGRIKSAKVTSSTVGDEEFEKALLKVIKRWRFPKPPGGGNLVVNYPFIFRTAP